MTERKDPWFVSGTTRPKPVPGFEWQAVRENPLKPQQIQGWRRVEVSAQSHGEVKVSAQHFSFKLPDLPGSDSDS